MHRRHRVHGPEVRQHGAQPVLGRDLGVDEHPDDAQRAVVGSAQHMAEQQQGRLVGGVQVVDHQQDGAAACELVERRGHRLEEAEPLALRVAARILNGRGILAQAQDQPGELAELPVGHVRNPVRREGLEVPPERLRERLERCDGILVAAAPQDQTAAPLDGARQLGHQTCLADARIAVDQQQTPHPLADRRPPVTQQRRLPVPADQPSFTPGGGDPDLVPAPRRTGRRHCRRPRGRACPLLGRDREVQRGVLGEDGAFHPGHVVPWLDPELGHQEGP